MPDPRTIALEKNDKSQFSESPDASYDGVAGVPKSVAGQKADRDYAAHATNPPEKPAPVANLKR